MNKTDVLQLKLENIKGDVPVNYHKAKLTFSNKLDFNQLDMVRFIAIDKFSTKQGIASGPNKPISRIFSF
jgi:hypothetical protein